MDSRRQNRGASELRGVVIRVMSEGPCLPQCLRETVGPPSPGCTVCAGPHCPTEPSAAVEMSRAAQRG